MSEFLLGKLITLGIALVFVTIVWFLLRNKYPQKSKCTFNVHTDKPSELLEKINKVKEAEKELKDRVLTMQITISAGILATIIWMLIVPLYLCAIGILWGLAVGVWTRLAVTCLLEYKRDKAKVKEEKAKLKL